MKLSILASGAALACALSVSAQAAPNLIMNGDFEMPLVTGSAVTGADYRPGTTLTNWQFVAGPGATGNGAVQFNSSYAPGSAMVGADAQSVQLEFAGDSISQSFSTSIGQSYLLTFLLSAYAPGPSSLNVFIGPASGNFSGNSSAYTPESLSFIANTTTTTLTFANAGPTFVSYPHLDNISVTAVPEPETYALLLAGLGVIGMSARRMRRDGNA